MYFIFWFWFLFHLLRRFIARQRHYNNNRKKLIGFSVRSKTNTGNIEPLFFDFIAYTFGTASQLNKYFWRSGWKSFLPLHSRCRWRRYCVFFCGCFCFGHCFCAFVLGFLFTIAVNIFSIWVLCVCMSRFRSFFRYRYQRGRRVKWTVLLANKLPFYL